MIFLWLLISIFNPVNTLHADECLTTEVLLNDKHVPFSSNEIHITSSNNTLKTLNQIFGESESDGQVYAEHLTLLYHGLLQVRLEKALDENPDIGTIKEVTSNYIKTTELKLEVHNETEFIKLLKTMRKQIALDISNYFLTSKTEKRTKLLNEIGNKVVFFEKNLKLNPIDEFQIDFIRLLIDEKIGGQEFRDLLRKQLAIGVSPHRQLANIEARAMSKIEPFEIREDIGNLSRVFSYFSTAKKLQKSVYNWAFSKNDNNERKLQLFKTIRQNRSKDPSLWPPEYTALLKQKKQSTLEQAHNELQSYIEYLSILKELPSEVISKTAATSRDQFPTMKNPELMVYIDIKGLGARNLVDVDNNIEGIHQSLKELKQYVLSQENGEINSEVLKEKYQKFIDLHKRVLENSIDFTTELHKEMKALIFQYTAKFGVKPIIWVGGDDAFILIPKSSIEATTIGKLIKFDSSFGEDVRVATATTRPQTESINLKDIRVKFSETVDILKTHELTRKDEYYAIVTEEKQTIIITQDNTASNTDAESISSLKQFLKSTQEQTTE